MKLVLVRPEDTFDLSPDLQPIFMVFISSTMAIGVVGNAMVILVILKIKSMFNSTNIFLSNLAIADLMVLLTWGSESVYDVNHSPWLFTDLSEGMCYGIPFIKDTLTYASVLTILAIAFERYYAICQPLRAGYICTKKRAYWICLIVWAVAALSSSPQFLFTFYHSFTETCYHKDEGSLLSLRTLYYITTVSAFFFLPVIMLTILFVIISRHLKMAVAPNVNIAATQHHLHVVTMLTAVIICFFLCHLPYRVRVLLFVTGYDWSTSSWEWFETPQSFNLFFFSRILVYLHSAVNPILYNFMSQRFRAGFKNVFCDVVQGFCRRGKSWCLGDEDRGQTQNAEHAI